MTAADAHVRTCPLCEATCGLIVEVADGAVTRIRGDRDDVFSRGYLCPKGSSLKGLYEDTDRVRTPLAKVDTRDITIRLRESGGRVYLDVVGAEPGSEMEPGGSFRE